MPGWPKPLDIGNGAVCASFAADGAWLSLGAPHPSCGFVELNGMPPFEKAWRGDPAATRRYRASMSDPRHAFLRMVAPGRAVRFELEADERQIVQRWRLSGGQRQARLQFGGRLDRPALAEITEVNPPRPTGAVTRVRAEATTLWIEAEALPGRVQLSVRGTPQPAETWRPLSDHEAELVLPPANEELVIEVAARMVPAWPAARFADPSPRELGGGRLLVPDDVAAAFERIASRALAYVRGCTALRTGDDERVILTDHRLLPLSWTRDAYYQALLLLASDTPGDREIVADHLRWLWRRCERPDARWMRSHHADGRRKDLAFQIDQQLYPILELSDYWRATRSLPAGVDWSSAVAAAWFAALAEVESATGLAATTESAADDPAPMPFILSSQVLLWLTARRLAELAAAGAIGLDAAGLDALADRVRAAVDRHLLTDDGWAYATDAHGGHVRYHDANDLPTALAPLWGFCAPDDPAWLATMRFALSPSNPGFFDGPFGGLGSLHTRGPWPLGDVQGWLFGSLSGDEAAAAAAARRLRDIAFDDGMLPEAYDPATGMPIARDWFAWPGATLGALLLLDAAGRLDRLAAAPQGTEQFNSVD